MKGSRWLSPLLAALFALLLYLHFRNGGKLVGELAPDFTLPLAHGEGAEGGDRLRLSDLRGSIVVLDFWASWCPPCRESIPHLNRVASELAGSNVHVLGINAEGHGAQRTAMVARRWGIGYRVLQDESAAVQRAYGVDALPSVFVVDREGIVRRSYAGSPTAEQLIRTLRELAD
jgi:cytochrome c biogenesis protein CcmG, thiol:disulfide interchange protein DsbE